ncbi:MAG: transcriptional regulator GcvA [Gammaproteobacteria bacterium]|nr:transcriptional regulator GcvA [Gammaproteobacteria bacterium]
MTRLPPISGLRALEAAARHLSYTRAAEELNVTQSAVSHQIRHIEELWDLQLFERRGRRLVLTEAGHALVPIMREFMQRLTSTLEELAGSNEDETGSLRISLLQSFAFKWLVPRLGDFNRKHPEINVWISTSEELTDLNREDVDLAIRLGYGHWPGLYVKFLFREYVFPVASPAFLERQGRPETPRDLLKYPLIQRTSLDICPRWRDWFRDAKVRVRSLPRGTHLPDTSMGVLAAIDGQGIALARSAHVMGDLEAGRLVKLFNVFSPSPVAYYIVARRGTETQPHAASFIEWLSGEAHTAQREFDEDAGVNPPEGA